LNFSLMQLSNHLIRWQFNAFRGVVLVKNVRMGKKGDLSYFERGMVVGVVGVFHNLLSYWDFHAQPFLGFTKNGVKRDENIQFAAVL